jgi:hypothetical protein
MRNRDMYLKSRSWLTILLIIFLNLSFFSGSPAYGADPPGEWVKISERDANYYVNQSTDDVHVQVNGEYYYDHELAPFRLPGYDTANGFIWNITDRVSNSTHREIVEVQSDASFWVWSADPTPLPYGSMTVYQIEGDDIGTFQNYTDFMGRTATDFVGNVPLAEFGRGSNPSGWEGWRGSQLEYLYSTINDLEFGDGDNDTIALKFYTIPGDIEYFTTYDENASRAPRLSITWSLYEYQTVSPPDGGADEDYYEEYRGFHIWFTEEEGWLDYTTFSQYGSQPKETGINATYFYVTNMYEDTDSYFRRDYDTYRDDSEPIINVKFGLTIDAIPWVIADGYVTTWAVSEDIDDAFDYDKGFTYTIRSATDRLYFYAWSLDGGVLKDSVGWGPTVMETELPRTLYFNVTLNMNTFLSVTNVYEDLEMTVLNNTWTDTYTGGPAWAGGAWLSYEWANGATQPGNNVGWTGAHLSQVEIEEGYRVTDDDGNEYGPVFPTPEDAEDYIDQMLGGLAPDYDALPNLGSNIVLIMGIMGLIMIPGSFIVAGHTIRQGDWTHGLYLLIMMFVLGFAFVTGWLFG